MNQWHQSASFDNRAWREKHQHIGTNRPKAARRPRVVRPACPESRVEPLEGRCLLSASPIASGQTVSGQLAPGAQAQFYFHGKKGGNIEVSVAATAGNLAPDIHLVGPDGSVVAYNYTTLYGGGTTLRAVAPGDGTYYVAASDYYGGNAGSYNLAVASVPGAQAADPQGGNTPSGQPRAGSINGNLHVYTFAARHGAINVSMGATAGDLAPDVHLYAPDGSLVAYNYTSLYGGGTTFHATGSQDGTYYLVAKDYYGGNSGSYVLTTSYSALSAHAPTIVSGQTVSGQLAPGGQAQFYFQGKKGGNIELSMAATRGDLAPDVNLVGPDGSLVAYNYTTLYGGGTTLRAVAPQDGIYYLVASDYYGGGSGSYNLAVASVPGTQATDPQGGNLPSGQVRAASLDGNLHVYTFSAKRGAIAVSMGATSGDIAPDIHLYAPDGSLVTYNYTTLYGGGTVIRTTGPQDGTYYLVAKDYYGSGSGTCNLTATYTAVTTPPTLPKAPGAPGEYDAALRLAKQYPNPNWDLDELLKRNEGFVAYVYPDPNHIPTVGIGYNLNAQGTRGATDLDAVCGKGTYAAMTADFARMKQAWLAQHGNSLTGFAYSDSRFKTFMAANPTLFARLTPITLPQARALVDRILPSYKTIARNAVGPTVFDALPANVRSVAIDIAYNQSGTFGTSRWAAFVAAVRKHDYIAAGIDMFSVKVSSGDFWEHVVGEARRDDDLRLLSSGIEGQLVILP